ncbi:MAG: YihY/virulence factor BrkB family protein [Marmoricola sp.]
MATVNQTMHPAHAEVRLREWPGVLTRVWKKAQNDQLSLLAAGVAFYAFTALFPTMIAVVLLYGLVSNPAEAQRQMSHLSGTIPSGAVTLLTTQLQALTSTSHASLGLGLVVSLMLALWSASGGVGNVITTLNIAYGAKETRGWIQRKALALGLTAAAIVFVVVAIGLLAVVPPLLDHLVHSALLQWLFGALRWILLIGAMGLALAVLYRVAPNREEAEIRWVSPGAELATVVWIVGSIGFSLYAGHFGSYNKTYGALAGVVVLLIWLWLTAYVVLLGAAINAETEHQATDPSAREPRETPRGDE